MMGRTLSLMLSLTNLGGTLLQAVVALVMDVIATIFPSRPGVAKILYDNYWNKQPLVQLDLSVLGQKVIK